MAPTAQQLSSEWMTEAEKETETDRLIRKSKQSPFIPIGELSVVYVLAYNYVLLCELISKILVPKMPKISQSHCCMCLRERITDICLK